MANGRVSANIQSTSSSPLVGSKSLKSQRTYQVGVIYKDIYGRETPVFTSGNGSFTIPKTMSDKRNSIVANLDGATPSWVDTFKFFVKETSNEYYNACMDKWYDAEDDNLWLSFPSAERNKIKEDGFIILKKQAGGQDAVYEEAKYKVIDIKNEAPLDIKTNFDGYGESTVRIIANGATAGSKTVAFLESSWAGSVFYDALLTGASNAGGGVTESGFIGWPLESVVIKISAPNGVNTGWLDVGNIYVGDSNDIYVDLAKALANDAIDGVIDDTSAYFDAQIKFAKKIVKNQAEFDGKFFVKIARDAVLDTKVREVGNITANFETKQSVKQYFFNPGSASASSETFWKSCKENWFIDGASRAKVGSSGGATNYQGPYARDYGYGMIGNESGKRSGNAQSGLQCTMELTLTNIKDSAKDGYDVSSNNTQKNQNFLSKMKQDGTLFRWKEDPWQHIYRVMPSHSSETQNTTSGPPNEKWKRGILNYSSYKTKRKDGTNKSIRLYLKFVTTGWRLSLPQTVSGTQGVFIQPLDEKELYPFKYNNQYPDASSSNPIDGSLVLTEGGVSSAWNPTRRGFGNYDPAATTNDSEYDDGLTHDSASNSWKTIAQSSGVTLDKKYRNTIQIVEMAMGEEEATFTKEPAIWETEPREDVGLDIYYEASQAYPTKLTDHTNELFAPYGSTITCVDAIGSKSFHLPPNTILWDWTPTGNSGNVFVMNARADEVGIIDNDAPLVTTTPLPLPTDNPRLINNGSSTLADLNANLLGLELQFTRPDGSYTTAKVKEYSAIDSNNPNLNPNLNPYALTGAESIKITLDRDLTNSKFKLPYFNCYSFNNGVESDRIRDDFNAVTIGKGVKVSTVLPGLYKEEQRTNGLIYSGIYNSNSSTNNLNQFIGAEKITKDVPPTYGSIQKIKARDTNLVVFCEDKILKIIAYKDALYNADGKAQLISTNNVLGSITSFSGEFGISTNPESYAEDSFRMYCTDKQRGKVLRISGDGVTPISQVGMVDYFGDNLKQNDTLLGSFDDRKQEYNLTLKEQGKTLSFSEGAKGWTSFKSFLPEDGLSINNNYYTFKNGKMWEHHINEVRNNFYDAQYDAHVDVLFNEKSESVKNFTSMKYEGTQSKTTQNLGDNEYYNNEDTSTISGFLGKQGWYVESGTTDLQSSGEMEFKGKEGKWFSYMKGDPVKNSEDLKSEEFSFQGIALLESITDGGDGSDEGFSCSTQNIAFTVVSNATGELSISAAADDMPYSISFVGANGYAFNSPIPLIYGGGMSFSNLPDQQYTVTVISANGCQATQQITLTGPPSLPVFQISVFDLGDQD